MWDRIKLIILPPAFEDDEDKSRLATLLSATVYTIFLIAIIRCTLTYFISIEYLPFVTKQYVIFAGTMATVLVITRLGSVRIAAILFTLYQWLAVASITFYHGGVSLSIYSFFIFVILSAGLLLGGSWAVGYALASISYGILLYYLDYIGIIAEYPGSPTADFIAITPSFITTAVLVYLYHRDMMRALTRARDNAGQLIKANAQLKASMAAQKQAEQDLYLTKFAIEHSADSVFWSRQNGSFVYVNEAACRSLGYTCEELLGMTVADIDPNYPAQTWKTHWQDLKDKKALLFETVHQRNDGSRFPVEVRASFLDYQGQELNCSIVRDITDRRKIEEELRHAQKMEAIGTLAGGIAHDFNNILTSIIGNGELAKLNLHRNIENCENNLDKILQGTARAGELVKQILTFSRKTKHEKKPLKISLILEEALKLLRASMPATIEIIKNIESTSSVMADPTQIHQVIMNLCTNAYHAMREKGGTLAVCLKDVDVSDGMVIKDSKVVPGPYLRLEVSDTGCGMDRKTEEKIFEPYFTTKESGEGTGLGLAVVFGIVQSHNGYINVYSEKGKGTTFHVYLPINVDEAGNSRHKDKDEEILIGGNERILFIDDEEELTELGKSILGEYGYSVTAFNNGKKALEELADNQDNYDLVITDMTMPQMTGLELAEQILKIVPDMPIIICTGHSDLLNREKAESAGISEYCEKPIRTRDLLKTVRNLLDGKSLDMTKYRADA